MLPLVLHHGLFGMGQVRIGGLTISGFRGIDQALAGRGYPVIMSRVHPTGGIERRARQLKETILRQLDILRPGGDDARVIIVAHSLGGLDARYMISQLGMDDRVAALVTICSPHRGNSYADWCLRNLGQRLGGIRLMRLLRLDMQGIADLTTESCRQFNEQVPDSPHVRYYSISAARPAHRVPPFFLHAHHLVTQCEGANDGMVSVRSAAWGRHLDTWPADHLHVINTRLVLELRNPTGDITPYYLRMMEQVEADATATGCPSSPVSG